MGLITNPIRVLNVDTNNGKYAIPLTFRWPVAASDIIEPAHQIWPGYTAMGIASDFDLRQVNAAAVLPPIRQIQGTIIFGHPSGAAYMGNFFISLIATQQVWSIGPINNSAFQSASVSFSFPIDAIETSQSHFEFFKVADSPGVVAGNAQLCLLTYQTPSTVFSF